jgi:hypothetical protein
MVDRAEVLAVAAGLSLAPEVVEKDYVLARWRSLQARKVAGRAGRRSD